MKPIFPTVLHKDTAEIVKDYFLEIAGVDTVLCVNSCARGQASPESDLDFAVLVQENTSNTEIEKIHKKWLSYVSAHPVISAYKKSSCFAHLHLDIINGIYQPVTIEPGEPVDSFEIEIGNQICYSAPMDHPGVYFKKLQQKWLPYYSEDLRRQRLKQVIDACSYDLDHISYYKKRALHFHALYVLNKAFQEYLQALFIAGKIYPIAYNKWIRHQVIDLLKKPELFPLLAPVLSLSDIESDEINDKVKMLYGLLNDLC